MRACFTNRVRACSSAGKHTPTLPAHKNKASVTKRRSGHQGEGGRTGKGTNEGRAAVKRLDSRLFLVVLHRLVPQEAHELDHSLQNFSRRATRGRKHHRLAFAREGHDRAVDGDSARARGSGCVWSKRAGLVRGRPYEKVFPNRRGVEIKTSLEQRSHPCRFMISGFCVAQSAR